MRVQLKHWLSPAALSVGVMLTAAPSMAAIDVVEDQQVGTMLRLFTDSDKVGVRSVIGNYAVPLKGVAELGLHWNNERVTIPGIAAPVGSAEAVDAITTASRPISSGDAYQDFIKVRNEFTGELSRGNAAVDYYLSSESDYLGQQLGARYAVDFRNQQFNLAAGASYGWDAIEPLADDDTQAIADSKTTIHWNAVATQVLSPTTLVRVGVEHNSVEGLQHNPYRNVYAGGTNVPERHPNTRERNDAFVKLNQYLPNRSSLRLNYRYYVDDWGITSHEAGTKLSQYITAGIFARYQYRYYAQTAADFYRDDYTSVDGVDGYRSGDYRMAELSSHLFGCSLNLDLGVLAPQSMVMRHLGVWVSYDRYFNSNNYSANFLESGLDVRF